MGRPGALLFLVCVRLTMRLHIIDALGLAFLIIAGGCALAVLFGIFEATITALFEGRGVFARPKRRKP